MKIAALAISCLLLSSLVAGCAASPPATPSSTTEELSGVIEIDGSSTVYPITEAVAEEFHRAHPSVQVNVGVSGTGGGFKRFTVGETDISDASRPIKPLEAEQARANGVDYLELQIALDGISLVVNPQNDFVDYLTVEELKRIWEPGSKVDSWDDVRPEWPSRRLNLYGPGTDSGTFDYFTEAIMGQARASRSDYTASEDDNVLVQGIAGDRNALGYFGYAYYAENADKLKLVAIDSGSGPVLPTEATIQSGEYTPLSRPLFIYVNKKSLERPEVKAFLKFYMENAAQLVREVGYLPLEAEIYQQNLASIR